MTKAKTPALSEKDRRAQALQKALRDNLRRRKAASAVESPEEGSPEPGADGNSEGNVETANERE